MPLNIALLGAGTFARSAHFNALLPLVKSSQIQISFIWSRSSSSAFEYAQLFPHPPPTYHDTKNLPLESAKQALLDHKIDAVIVALPISDQPSFVELCLSLSLPVLFEKPLANDVETAKRILNLADKYKTSCAVAENFRFESAFRIVRQHIVSLGNVVGFNLVALLPMAEGSKYGRGWRLKMPNMGVVLDVGVHLIAGLRVVLDADVKQVSASCSQQKAYFNGMDTVTCNMTFENDVSGTLLLTMAASTFSWTLTIVCENGNVILERIPGKPGYIIRVARQKDGQMEEESEQVGFTGVNDEFAAFIKSCENGTLHPDLSAHTAFNDLATMQAMYESAQSNNCVKVDTL